jgi:serine/threonine-protein phosphatase 4 regulatory subunit 1
MSGDNEIIIACAYNLPCIMKVFGASQWQRIRELFITLVQININYVKYPIACSLHELARIVGKN